jgi:hypothetical protein
MVLAEKDKPGVRGQTKRFFPETMKVEVHLKLPLNSLISSRKKGKWSGRGDLNSRLLGPEPCKRENVTH